MNQQNNLVKFPIKPFAYFIMFFAGLGGMLYGYDIGVISGALIFMQGDLGLNATQLSIIVAAVLGGGAIATLVTGPLADTFGRRTMIITSAIVFIVGVLILLFSHSYVMVLTGRLVQGVGIGIITIIIPLYLSEAAPSAIRGRSVTVFQLFLTGGILLAFIVDLLFERSGSWRGMFICVLIPAILLLLGALIIPRSPRWLFSRGRQEEAFAALMRSHSPEEAAFDFQEMKTLGLEKSNLSMSSFLEKLMQRQYALPFAIALAIACLNQLTGINSILQFSTLMLKSSGLGSNFVSMIGSVGVGLINFIVTVIGLSLIDRVGRKPLLSIGTGGTVIALIYSGCITLMPDGLTKGILLSIGLFFFILFFAIGPGIVVWLALSELLPTAIRSKGMAICLFVNSAVSAILASLFLTMAHAVGYQLVFWICAVCTAFYFLLAVFALPETKNRSLEQIEEHFTDKNEEGKF